MKSIYLGLGLLLLLWSSASHSQNSLYLHLREEVRVYAQPNPTSTSLGRFRAGARLLISTQDHRGWRKVLFMDRGRRRMGWIYLEGLQHSYLSKSTSLTGAERTKKGLTLYRNAKAFGLAFVPSYAQQKERSVALSDEASVYAISELSGLSMWLSAFIDWPMDEKSGLRTYLAYRNLLLTGSTKLNEIGGHGGSTEEVKISQVFLGLGATYKAYISQTRFWWGGGLEVSRNMSASVEAGGVEIPVSDEDKPLFFFPHIALGWDSKNMGRFYFVPDLKLGPVTSFEPTLYNLEAHLALAYQW